MLPWLSSLLGPPHISLHLSHPRNCVLCLRIGRNAKLNFCSSVHCDKVILCSALSLYKLSAFVTEQTSPTIFDLSGVHYDERQIGSELLGVQKLKDKAGPLLAITTGETQTVQHQMAVLAFSKAWNDWRGTWGGSTKASVGSCMWGGITAWVSIGWELTCWRGALHRRIWLSPWPTGWS